MSDSITTMRRKLHTSATVPSATKPPGWLKRLMKKGPVWVRRHERFPCCVLAGLELIDKDLMLEGLVTELSQGGLLFRPASHFVFDRTGANVIVRFEEDELHGVIVNVKSGGYGVRFHDDIALERVKTLVEQFGFANAA